MGIREKTLGGPFHNPFGGVRADIGGFRFHLACARGYNARGVTHRDQNGIFVVYHATQTVVLDQHYGITGCWFDSPTNIARAECEIARMCNLSAEEFSQLIDASVRKRFNPFAESFAIGQIAKHDKKMRKAYDAKRFCANEFMTSPEQRTLVHAWEMFVVAALFTDEASLLFKKFTPAVYKFLCLYGGYIAHTSRSGFFHEHVLDRRARMKLIRYIADGNTTLGRSICTFRKELRGVVEALTTITSSYLS